MYSHYRYIFLFPPNTYLGVALHHDVIDVGLEGHADVLPLPRVKLEDVQHARHAHLEEDGLAAAAELHDVPELRTVQILLGDRPEEMDPPLVDAQDEPCREQPDRVLYPLDREEDGVACMPRVQC